MTAAFFLLLAAMAALGIAACVFVRSGGFQRGKPDGREPRRLAQAVKGAVAVFIPLFAGALYLEVGSPGAVSGSGDPASGIDSHQGIDLDEAVARLKERVRTNPEDGRAFGLLYRTLMSLGRYPEALEVVRRRADGTADLLVMEAEALAMSDGGGFGDESLALVERALAQEPEHPQALWLAGIAATERGDHMRAAALFAKAGDGIGDPELRAQLDRLEADARSMAGAERPQAALRVRIALAPELENRIRPGQAMFVFAREPDGPPAPIAAAKVEAGMLPVLVTLDDSSAMMPGRQLSAFETVEVVARISASGAPQAQSGDLYGLIEAAAVGGGEELTLTIDRRVP